MIRLIAIFLLVGSIAHAKQPETRKRYIVKEVKGRVLAWPPLAPSWREIKKDELIWEDTLIQVSRDASITFELTVTEGFTGIKAESMIITLNTPVLMRLRENIPRRLVLNDYFIPKLPPLSEGGGDKDTMDLMYEKFGEAWERFAVNVLHQDIERKYLKDLKDSPELDTSVSMRAKKIKIYTPAAGALHIVNNLPQEMRVTWKKVNEPGLRYGIRVWQPDKRRPDPMAYTTSDFYSVKIGKEGQYLVQIASEDGRWQSEVRQFSMLLPMTGRGEPPSLTRVNLPLPLQLPPRNFVFHTAQMPVSLTFAWDRPNAAVGHQIYTFVLSDEKGKELYKKDTSDMTYNLKFSNPGNYRWFIAATPQVPDPENPARIFSEVRTISILKPVALADAGDPIADLLGIRASRVFYLEKLW